jgi:hypothetical protein
MIEAGSLLIEKSASRPECFQVAENTDSSPWATVAADLSPKEREKALTADGWTFAYMAGAIEATAVGFNPANRMTSALKQLTALAAAQQCNCVEIDAVVMRTFLGVPYLRVSAHSRDIQRDRPLRREGDRRI